MEKLLLELVTAYSQRFPADTRASIEAAAAEAVEASNAAAVAEKEQRKLEKAQQQQQQRREKDRLMQEKKMAEDFQAEEQLQRIVGGASRSGRVRKAKNLN